MNNAATSPAAAFYQQIANGKLVVGKIKSAYSMSEKADIHDSLN